MSEYVWTVYHIGGELPENKAAILKDFLRDFEDKDMPSHDEPSSICAQGQLNYGNYDELDEFLIANNLPFHASWAAQGGCFDAGIRYWSPGMNNIAEVSANDEGEPISSLAYLKSKPITLHEIIAELEKASAKRVPNFSIKNGSGRGVEAVNVEESSKEQLL